MSIERVLLFLLLFLGLYILWMLGQISNSISDFNAVLQSLDSSLRNLLTVNRKGVDQLNQDHESIVKTGQALSSLGRFVLHFEKSIFRYLHRNLRGTDQAPE